ncbi:MAG TPA: RagB/SusD family nutrient uptake outer membrane protein [Gemmatimonadaceae bacterium]|nr:RagB/SusD family nutrient uptake outer membrane protein [Gemmatimonadaceae bacterium]
MRKHIRAIALLAALTAGIACDDDFITEAPSDFVAPENFYRNAGDALSALTSAYATFINLPDPLEDNQYVGRNLWMLVEYPTEVTTSRLSATNERSLIGNYNAQFISSHPYVEGVWQAAYSGINRANMVIERVPTIDMNATRRDQIVGEAKFLRAVHYYWLAGLFGGVPLKLTPTASIEAAGFPRATAAATWAQIQKDLTEAAAVLPTSWPAADFGRATKGAALTLLGKSYLQGAATGQTTNADYTKAADAFRQVLALGYRLETNYASLFDGSNERNAEVVWSIQNVRVPNAGGYLSQWFVPVTSPAIYTGGNAQNQFQAERPFYDSYNSADIRKAGTWLISFVNAGKTVTWAWTAGIQTAANYGSTGPSPRKYLDLNPPASGAEAPDYMMLRYADVLLSLAEAINATSGPTGEAYGLVNQVRTRAGVPNLTAGLNTTAFRDSLFVERRFELAMEMHGVFDSRRNWTWAKSRLESYMGQISTWNRTPFTSSVEKFTSNTPIADKWRLYPIPAHACELNPELTQNPGWDDGICKPAGG